MSETILHLGNKTIKVIYKDFEDMIDLDELTKIDYGNLYGEAVSISVLLMKLGIMRADAEQYLSEAKLDQEFFAARQRKHIRKIASENGQKYQLQDGSYIKITENSIDEIILSDIQFQQKKKVVINAKKQYDYIDAIFWSANSKDKKLNNIIKGVTPEELYHELVEGAINGMYIKKLEMKYKNR